MTQQNATGGPQQVTSLRMIAAAMAMGLVMIALVSFFMLETEPQADPMVGWILAVAAPVVSFLASRAGSVVGTTVQDPSQLYQAYASRFFITLSLAEAPGLLVFVAGIIMRLSWMQVALGLVLTAAVVWLVLHPTRQKADAFAETSLGAGADVQAFVEAF
ncbi:hypothetical protein DUY81_09090 [Acidipropionibacterium acidipropionici]|jgi:uncharacterized membrane protein|uniref:Uncharacterized protein n=1 Tax=Acidipropionibacterium acidipropionici TaxID=1748 RepID=A0AAC8YDT8_9ACTN|nr:hypothetical protein [Acidipropionibacterium acidipropionici]AMS04549.1 hypothetical protein AXH35_02695 [Acidipropionibacterium acidipropionici]AOZ46042.1 hypothetical protein A8L58_04160 [Acidipropionibacterium acidipropionici]AZP37931.1 hypothetical protein DUY81_09090 [Acidipropionibacterium acidipropionici]